MFASKEEEVKNLAEKAVRMEPQSIRTLIFAADVLLARDQMEHREPKADAVAGI